MYFGYTCTHNSDWCCSGRVNSDSGHVTNQKTSFTIDDTAGGGPKENLFPLEEEPSPELLSRPLFNPTISLTNREKVFSSSSTTNTDNQIMMSTDINVQLPNSKRSKVVHALIEHRVLGLEQVPTEMDREPNLSSLPGIKKTQLVKETSDACPAPMGSRLMEDGE